MAITGTIRPTGRGMTSIHAWDATLEYQPGAVVWWQGQVYRALDDNERAAGVAAGPVLAGEPAPDANQKWAKIHNVSDQTNVATYDGAKTYVEGDLVRGADGRVYYANTAVPASPPGAPAQNSPTGNALAWDPVTTPDVTVSNNTGDRPPAGTGSEGDIYINTADHLGWVFSADAGNWVDLPSAQLPNTFTSRTPNEQPATGQPNVFAFPQAPKTGDLFVNIPDTKIWIAAAPPAGSPPNTPPVWVPAITPPPTVTEATTAGLTPATFTPTLTPREGDIFVNTTDGRTWVFNAPNWLEIPTASTVVVALVAGETPAAPGTATMPANPHVGDVFVNRPDGLAWIRTADATSAIPNWEPLKSTPTVTVSTTANEVPANPGTGQTAFAPALTPKIGDIFVNRVDQATWVYGPAPGGGASVWERVTDNRIVHSSTTGETPAAPGMVAVPAVPEVGDMFYNETDRSLWVYMPNVGGIGNAWQLLPLGATVLVSDTAGETPQAPGGVVMPANPAVGTVFVNTTDRKLWIFHDDPAGGGTPTWSALPDAEANHVWVEPTDGTLTPATFTFPPLPGQTAAPEPSVGDLFYNNASDNLWAWDGAAWQPMNAQTAHVFVSATANEVPQNPAGGQTVYDFAAPFAAGGRYAGQALKEGDRYINTQDLKNYIYAPDPTTPGQLIWVEVPADNRAWVSDTPGEDAAAFTFQPPPKIGDIYYNRPDKRLWVRANDPAAGAVAWVEVDLKSATHYVAGGTFDPTAVNRGGNWGFLGTASPDVTNTPPKDGDTFFLPETGQGGYFTASNPNNPPDGAVLFDPPQTAPIWSGGDTYREGDLVWHNNALYRAWNDIAAGGADPEADIAAGARNWDPVTPTVHNWLVSDVAGRTPQNAVTAGEIDNEPNVIFINSADRRAWANVLDTAGTLGWEEITPVAHVYATQTTGENPTANPPATQAEGDVFVNVLDGRAWVRGPDPATPGQLAWLPLSASPKVYVSNTANQDPAAAAAATPAVIPAATQLHEGDIFVNTFDNTAWIYGPDLANPGQFVWVPVRDHKIYLSSVKFDEPWGSLPTIDQGGTAREGDIFINEVDETAFVVARDPSGALDWYPVAPPVDLPKVWVTIQDGETPTTPPQGLPATYPETATVGTPASVVRPGSVYINKPDGKVWIAGNDPVTGHIMWELVAELEEHAPDFDPTKAYRKFDLVRVSSGDAPGYYRALVDVGPGGAAPNAVDAAGIWELVVADADASVFNVANSALISRTPPDRATVETLKKRGLLDGDLVVVGENDPSGQSLTLWRYNQGLNSFSRITPQTANIFYGIQAPTTQLVGVTPKIDDLWIVTPVLAAVAGAPGNFIPAAGAPPNLADIQARGTLGQTTRWNAGEHVVLGDGSQAYWDGSAWQQGVAPPPPPTGLTTGMPGAFTPAGAAAQNLADLAVIGDLGQDLPWSPGQFVRLADGTNAYWDGIQWRANIATAPAPQHQVAAGTWTGVPIATTAAGNAPTTAFVRVTGSRIDFEWEPVANANLPMKVFALSATGVILASRDARTPSIRGWNVPGFAQGQDLLIAYDVGATTEWTRVTT